MFQVRRARLRPRKPVHLYIFAKKCGSDEEPNSELLQLMVNLVIRGQDQPVAYDVEYLGDCAAQKARLNLGTYILDLAPSIVRVCTLHALKKIRSSHMVCASFCQYLNCTKSIQKAKVREIRANSASAMRDQDSSVSRVVRRLNLEDDIADAGNAEDAEDTPDSAEATVIAPTVTVTPTAILNCHYNPHKQPKEINSDTVELHVEWSNSQKTWEHCQRFFESHPELLLAFLSEAHDNQHMCCLLRQLKAQTTKTAASNAATKIAATVAVTNTTATATEVTVERQPPQIAKPAEPLDVPSATTAGAVSQEETEKSTEIEPPNTVKQVKRKSGKRKGRTSSKKSSKAAIKRKVDNQPLIGSRFKKDFGEGFGIHQGESTRIHSIRTKSISAFYTNICSHDSNSASADDGHLPYHTFSLPGTVKRSLYISSRLHYHVKYDDSDSEDLAEAELLSLMQSPEKPAE